MCETWGGAGDLPLAAGGGGVGLAFVVLGRALRGREPWTWSPRVAIAALSSGAIIVLSGVAPLDLKQAALGTPVLSLAAAILIGCGLPGVAAHVVPTGWSAAFAPVAATATFVMLTHGVVLLLMDTPATGGWLDFGMALLIPVLVGLLVIRTLLAPVLAGQPPRGW